jgi:hypothetical protein
MGWTFLFSGKANTATLIGSTVSPTETLLFIVAVSWLC